MLRQMPSRIKSRGNRNRYGFCAVLSEQISGQINSPCVCGIKGGVAQLTKALSNEWVGKDIADNSIDPWVLCCIKMNVVDGQGRETKKLYIG